MRTYLAASLALNLGWELLQMPLFTLWQDGSTVAIVYAAVHCSIGDVLIAGSALLGALVIAGNTQWPSQRYAAVAVAAIVLGIAFTGYSEWLNVYVRKSWAYSEYMPQFFGLGLSPLLQWLVIPAALFAYLRRI